MNPILTPVLLVVALGFVFAVILTIAAKVFFVPVDETVVKLREALPGANCGGCGSQAVMTMRLHWQQIRGCWPEQMSGRRRGLRGGFGSNFGH